ncbi:GntR family transcriptional regulator [Streptomyces sp. NPDC127068]|uniref:GntR family transcriptional regulator n=1 Tax=Streptomyces sp. NPDC127068 TaxID=3347127 RepID=UPI00365ECB49
MQGREALRRGDQAQQPYVRSLRTDREPRITELMDAYGLARQTVRDAIGELADEGLVVAVRKTGTVVRHRTPVAIPLSRYRHAMTPTGSDGPWQAATAAQGIDGAMELIGVERVPADEELGVLLDTPGGELVRRSRHAVIRPDDVVQIQHAWYPAQLAEAAGIATADKVRGGVYRALAAAGFAPATVSETVAARLPGPDEATRLRIGGKVSVLTVERLTRDSAGRPLEVLRTVAPADRIRLCYDDLPLNSGS